MSTSSGAEEEEIEDQVQKGWKSGRKGKLFV